MAEKIALKAIQYGFESHWGYVQILGLSLRGGRLTSLESVSSTNEISQFLNFLYGDSEGFIYAPTREKNRGSWTQNFYHWPEDQNKLVEFIQLNTSEREVYIAPAIFSSEDCNESFFQQSNVVWAEIDGVIPELKTIPMPTLKIMSSNPGHEHWYWKLTEPIKSKHDLELINKSLTYNLGADTSGWDFNQVLRPPSTINHKRDRTTSIIYQGDTRYSNLSFSHLDAGSGTTTEIDQTTIPDVATVILKYAFNEQSITQFRATPSEGERSTALMSLGYLCAEMGMSDVEIFSVIRNADDRWGKFKDRTDRVKRLSDLISRVRVKHPNLASTTNVSRFNVLGFRKFMESDIHIEWVIPGLLQRNGYFLLTGPSGVGKTQWSLQWAIHLALGKSYLEFEIPKPIKVIFFSLEMGHADLKFFISTMASELTNEEFDLLEQNLMIVPLGEALYMDGSKDQKLVEESIKEYKPDGIFIDSLGSSTAGELQEGTVKLIMDWNDRIRQRFGVFTWFIHHNRKAQSDNRRPNKLSDVYGGQYIVNRATSVYCLWPQKTNIEVIELKVRLKELADSFFIQRTKTLNFLKVANVTFYKHQKESSILSYKAPVEPSQEELNKVKVDEDGFAHDVKKPKPPQTGMMESV